MEYYGIHYDSVIEHHGIKGQKWGDRNGPPYPLDAGSHSAAQKKAGTSGWTRDAQKEVRRQDVLGSKRKSGDTILKKGTTFQRIGGDNLGYTKGVFASYKISDKDLYKGVLGRMRISYLAKTNQDVSLNELKLTTKKNMRVPSSETAKNAFYEWYGTHKEEADRMIGSHEKDFKKRNYDAQKYDSPDRDSNAVNKLYLKFNDALGYGYNSDYASTVDSFYSHMKKKGYDALVDENDTRVGTFKAQAPLIIFDTEKVIGKVSSRPLSAAEVYSSYARSMPKKMVRDLATTTNQTYFQNLSPDSEKAQAKYAERLLKDKTSLSENYTLSMLGEDWAKNRLSNRQIRNVDKYMRSGKSHDEAVDLVKNFSNTLVDSILSKKGL